MINIQLFISEPLRKLRAPREELPLVECSRQEAVAWYSGFWHGIGTGIVLGLGSAVIAGWALGLV